MFAGSLMQLLLPPTLADRALRLGRELGNGLFLGRDPVATLVRALYYWHGCISMAKMLRPTYVTSIGEVEYAMSDCPAPFTDLERCREDEEARGKSLGNVRRVARSAA